MKTKILLCLLFVSNITFAQRKLDTVINRCHSYRQYWLEDILTTERCDTIHALSVPYMREKLFCFKDLRRVTFHLLEDRKYEIGTWINESDSLEIFLITLGNIVLSPKIKPIKNLKIIEYSLLHKIKTMPPFIYECKQLLRLHIADLRNDKSIDERLGNLRELEYLNLSFRRLKKIPDLKPFKNLIGLSIDSRNTLKDFPDIRFIKKLKHLALPVDICKKEHIEILKGMKNLKSLGVKKCSLKEIELLKELYFIDVIYIRDISKRRYDEIKKHIDIDNLNHPLGYFD